MSRAYALPLLIAAAMLGGCTLQPLYAGGGQGAIAQSLAAVEVAPIEGEAGWLVRTALTDRLHANGRPDPAPARYRVNVVLDDAITGFGVRADDSVTRERRTLRARWQLVDATNGATLVDASAASDAGIDVVGSEFATIAAERTALEQLAQALADQIATRIALFARKSRCRNPLMLLKGPAAQRALMAPDPAIRLYVLGGPDDAASRALIDGFAKAMGPEAERVDLAQRQIRETPSSLADEVGAFGLFGGRRWVLVNLTSGSGDEWLDAAEHVLDADSGGNPAIITGGGMTAKSKLVKLAASHPAAVAVISYLPDEKDRARLAADIAGSYGLSLSGEVARAIAEATGGDRGLMAREAEKLALYVDVAATGAVHRVEIDAWRAIGADTPEEDVGAAVNLILDGRVQGLPVLFEELVALGTSEIRLVRALAMRAMLLARLRARIDNERIGAKVAVDGEHGLFWKEKDAVQRQLGRWTAPALARLVDRLHALERALKAPNNAGMLLLRDELVQIARVAATAR